VHPAPDPRHLPPGLQAGPGRAQARHQAHLHRGERDQLAETWGQRYGAIIRLRENAWSEFIPFLDYGLEIRKVICSTSAIESLNARDRRAIKARGHFPSGQAALKCLYLVTRSLDPTGTGRARWAMRWKSSWR